MGGLVRGTAQRAGNGGTKMASRGRMFSLKFSLRRLVGSMVANSASETTAAAAAAYPRAPQQLVMSWIPSAERLIQVMHINIITNAVPTSARVGKQARKTRPLEFPTTEDDAGRLHRFETCFIFSAADASHRNG